MSHSWGSDLPHVDGSRDQSRQAGAQAIQTIRRERSLPPRVARRWATLADEIHPAPCPGETSRRLLEARPRAARRCTQTSRGRRRPFPHEKDTETRRVRNVRGRRERMAISADLLQAKNARQNGMALEGLALDPTVNLRGALSPIVVTHHAAHSGHGGQFNRRWRTASERSDASGSVIYQTVRHASRKTALCASTLVKTVRCDERSELADRGWHQRCARRRDTRASR